MSHNLRSWPAVVAVAFQLTILTAAAPSYFVYVSDHRIITVEPSSRDRVILNVINLSDEILVIHPYDVLLQAGSRVATGQVFGRDSNESGEPFFATQLVNPREFVGLTVVGELVLDPDAAVFHAASRFFFLQKVEKRDFDILERQVAAIDLKNENAEQALRRAGILQGRGRLEYYPDGETESLERLFPEMGQVLPPRIIKKADPRAVGGEAPGTEIELKGRVSRSGHLLDPVVTQGISPESDRRAVAVVQNSWEFLPAVRDGQVVEASVTLKVRFAEQ
ncbi:MAG: energy transducer TonB [Acidobacteria bacterium]|nr:energy transducer TonB [Acidobacteriota bacterium]